MKLGERKNTTFDFVNLTTQQISANRFRTQLTSPWKFRIFLLTRMPVALLTGLYVRHLDASQCVVSVPFKRLTQNPFRSIYFASQAMAAEMSTGILAMAAIQGYHPSISMLVTNIAGEFHKKATERIYFTCIDGEKLSEQVRQALETGTSISIQAQSEGRLKDGTLISTFQINWSFKQKSK
jgi:Domain of unknown function (DUF4442)